MRRLTATLLILASTTMPLSASIALGGSPSGAANSPYPSTLPLHRGLTESSATKSLAWGTTLTRAQDRYVKLKSMNASVGWGVWKPNGLAATYPVRSTDGGRHWSAAGPQLATDWVGGGIYYVTRVISESSRAVIMVSNAVIDVTIDAGRQWYQYLNPDDNWSITRHALSGGGVGLRVAPASYAQLPKASYAIYTLDLGHLRWRRVAQSLS